MRALKILGWAIIPFIMIFISWKQLNKPWKIAGSAWAILLLIAVIANMNSDKSNPGAVDTSSTAVAATKTKADSKPVDLQQTPENIAKMIFHKNLAIKTAMTKKTVSSTFLSGEMVDF